MNRKKGWQLLIKMERITNFLTDGSFLALAAEFSPAAQQIAYLSYNNKVLNFLLDLNTGVSRGVRRFSRYDF